MKSMQMFDVEGKTALITGASGAFGMVAARILAEAGCKLVLAAGNIDALKAISAECSALGAEVVTVNQRPTDEKICHAMVDAAVSATGALDILVVASGMNKVALINDMEPKAFNDVMDANVTPDMAYSAVSSGTNETTGHWWKNCISFFCSRFIRASSWLHCLLCF